MSDNVRPLPAPNADTAKTRASLLAYQRLRRAHAEEWQRYFRDELARAGGEPPEGSVA